MAALPDGACRDASGGLPGLHRRTVLAGAAGLTGLIAVNSVLGAAAAASDAAQPRPAVTEDRGARGQRRGAAPAGQLGLDAAVFGAELQYFRMSRSAVRVRLEACRDAAYSVIQAYVPWNVHENRKGRLDFTGRTTPIIVSDHLDEYQIETPVQEVDDGGLASRVAANTDLHDFLVTCKRYGFKVILRPGPFISDEWRNGGLPDWLLRAGYPSMYQHGPDGSVLTPGAPFGSPAGSIAGGGPLFYFPSPSYASPLYLASARRWLAHFAKFVRPWLAHNHGPVVAVQVDDETCYFYRFGAFECDYSPAVLSRWRRATGHADAPRSWPPQAAGPQAIRPALQWQAFKAQQAASYLGVLATDLRRSGVHVPITHELELSLTPSGDISDSARTTLLTPELYAGGSSAKTLPANELTAQAVRAAQRNRTVPWATEMNNADIGLYDLLIGEGVVGGLQFTYTQGVPDGAMQELRRLGRTLRTAGPALSRGRRRADVAVVWDNSLAHYPYDTPHRGFDTDVRRTIENHLPATATLLVRAGYAFDLLDVHAARPTDYDEYPVVFLTATDVLPRATQHALVRYVRRGGRLICWPIVPTRDADLRPCHVLAKACFPNRVTGMLPGDAQRVSINGKAVTLWRGVRTYAPGHDATVVARVHGKPCGLRRRVGRGHAILLGGLLAADSPVGREGEILDEQPVPADNATTAVARAVALRSFGRYGTTIADALPATLPAGTHSIIAYQYSNERRGGDVISGGVLAAWDGRQVTGLAELNTAETAPTPVGGFPNHPIEDTHVAAIRRLAGVRPHVEVSDMRVQARVLDGAQAGTATIAAVNRSDDDVHVALRTRIHGKMHRLPSLRRLRLPANTGILLPIGYPLAHGARLRQATCQLVHTAAAPHELQLSVWSPSGGEVELELPHSSRTRTIHVAAGDQVIRVRLPR